MSHYGKERLFNDLILLGYQIIEHVQATNGQDYVVIKSYEIEHGIFEGRIIDLALHAPKEYPRTIGPSIQVKSSPHLLEKHDSIPKKRNVIDSPLGSEWRYWSFRFSLNQNDPTKDLMTQINGIFRNI